MKLYWLVPRDALKINNYDILSGFQTSLIYCS